MNSYPDNHNSIWNEGLPTALVLVGESTKPGFWRDPTGGLLSQVQNCLPDVEVISVSATGYRGVDSAIAAASFLGADTVVVVGVRGAESPWIDGGDLRERVRGIKVLHAESPPDAESVAAAYRTALLPRTPNQREASCAKRQISGARPE